MAANDLDSGAIKKQELEDMITCCICTEVFIDPKALPCIHTFCMKCIQETGLKTNKGPGDDMPCPICRRMFKIPKEGFHGLTKNFFIERLIQASNISNEAPSSRVLCDACLDDDNQKTGKEIPNAVAHCVECKYNLCEKCSKEHGEFKFTRNHKLMPLTEHDEGQNVMTPSLCELHEQKVMDVYCADCKTVVCAICFIDCHKNHEGSHVNRFVDGFQKQMENNAKADEHAHSLIQGLCLIRQRQLKEIQMETGDIDTYLSSLETYNSYSQQIIAKGSASDICRAFSDLSARAAELQEQCKPTTERAIQSFNFHFRKSELEEFLKETCENMIGEIEEDGDSKPKKRSKQSLLDEQSSEIDLLRKEIEIERSEKESLHLSNEQLRISVNTAMLSNKSLKDELDKNKADYDSETEKLKHDLDSHKTIISSIQANSDRLKQELDEKINQLKQDLDQAKIAIDSVQYDKDKLKQDLDTEKMTNILLNTRNSQLVQEVNMYKTTVGTLEDDVEKLRQELETMKKVRLRYKSDPVLVEIIRTKATEEGNKPIRGLTILDKELYVVSEKCPEIEVYDSIELSLKCRWNLKELIYPLNIGSCNINKCLYIADNKGAFLSKEILRVDENGKVIKKWSTGTDYVSGLSVSNEGSIILAVVEKKKLNEYSPDGQLVREIILSSITRIRWPWHTIKLSNGDFLVSHGSGTGDQHEVCLVDADGKLKKSFGGKCGSDIGQMNCPVHLSVDKNGSVMVADRENSRILLLDQDLEFKGEIISNKKEHRLRRPTRILLDDTIGRVFVVDNGWDSGRQIFVDGQILLFGF